MLIIDNTAYFDIIITDIGIYLCKLVELAKIFCVDRMLDNIL